MVDGARGPRPALPLRPLADDDVARLVGGARLAPASLAFCAPLAPRAAAPRLLLEQRRRSFSTSTERLHPDLFYLFK